MADPTRPPEAEPSLELLLMWNDALRRYGGMVGLVRAVLFGWRPPPPPLPPLWAVQGGWLLTAYALWKMLRR